MFFKRILIFVRFFAFCAFAWLRFCAFRAFDFFWCFLWVQNLLVLFVRAKSFREKKQNEKFKTVLITSFLLLLNVYLLKLSFSYFCAKNLVLLLENTSNI